MSPIYHFYMGPYPAPWLIFILHLSLVYCGTMYRTYPSF